MKNLKNNQPVIKNMHDLAIAKERYKYEVKLKEKSLQADYIYLSNNLKSAFKQTVNVAMEKLIYSTVMKLIQKK